MVCMEKVLNLMLPVDLCEYPVRRIPPDADSLQPISE